MTAILVVLTITLFLAIDLWRTRAQRHAAAEATNGLAPAFDADGFVLPQGLFLGSGHTWARLESDGSIVVGVDELASRLFGRADRLQVAAKGTQLTRHDAALVAHRGGKNLAFAAPVEGRVTAVNLETLQHPGRVFDKPYDDGWLLRLQPRRLAHELARLRVGDDAHEWLRHEVKRVGDFVSRHVPDQAIGASMADGGVPVCNMLDRLDASGWEQFEQEFLLGS